MRKLLPVYTVTQARNGAPQSYSRENLSRVFRKIPIKFLCIFDLFHACCMPTQAIKLIMKAEEATRPLCVERLPYNIT